MSMFVGGEGRCGADGPGVSGGVGGRARAASRVASQLGFGLESVRAWVRQADIDDGTKPGVSTSEVHRIRELEQENRELKRANEMLKRAAFFFGAELDRQHKK